MPLNRLRVGQWAMFLLILVSGLAAITLLYSSTQLDKRTPIEEVLTDRHKQLIATVSDMSKWLIGLASGTLIGLVGLRLGINKNDNSWIETVPLIAYAFLLLSLYGGFLSYQATANILRIGPLDNLYGDQYRFPILVQFWALVIALILIAGRLFGGKKSAILQIIAIMVMTCAAAHGEQRKGFAEKECAQGWFKERFNVDVQDVSGVLDLIHKVEKRSKLRGPSSCIDENAVLDEVRFSSFHTGAQDTEQEFDKYVTSLNMELSNPDASTSSVIHSVIDLLSPWDNGSLEVLNIKASRGPCTILLNGTEIGLTNWIRRIRPGTYTLTVVRNYRTVYTSNDLQLVAGKPITIDVDEAR